MRSMIIGLLVAGLSMAQVNEKASGIGIKGGINFGHLTGDDAELSNTETDMRPGLNIGAFVEIAVHPIISLQPEVQYTRKGERVTADGGLVDSEWNIKLDYVEIPLLVKVYFPLEAATRPLVYVGPFIGFNVNAETDGIYEVGSFNFETGANLDDDTSPVESGVAVGIGLRHVLESMLLSLDLRYTLGLTKTFDSDTFDDVFTGTLAGQVGIAFRLP